MLVLKRKTGEAIQIGDDIELTVLAIEGDQIKLGIDAPRHIDIHRKEIYLAIQDENAEASRSTGLMSQLLKQRSE
ncbi:MULTISPECIES: carbon storage regulator CsrA [Exiguobacterium]|uniref:Translational regulator CsrA n=1 Tax=Exiguobacterium oxidotolerans TaxID=223958 RepID=A0A653I9Q5_9BACL|nr:MULTISPECIES: carbon storage regulator CsrA [Exiguobacterium]ASI36290.1 carbon storage regulator [Exiguobacterium sp. N4-1P]VWX35869.1 carbon storage regulator [Exiguobacterium oxidotolerans]